MPAMADITVKKNDGTTDIIYNAMAPSSGDNVAAVWRSEASASYAAFKPTFEMRTRYNGPRDARRAEITFTMPVTQTDTASGITSVIGKVPVAFSIVSPLGAPDSVINEAVAQSANLLKSTLIQSALKAGFAPT